MNSKSSKNILPFRWAGGKFYALGKLRHFWEGIEHDEYREPFLGGGAVFWAKPKSQYNWLNDIDDGLIRTLQYIKDPTSRKQLLKLFENEQEATKEKYLQVRNIEPKTELEFVYRYYYLNRTSYSGKMRSPSWGYRPKRSLPPYRWQERINPAGEKLAGVKLTNTDFEPTMMQKPKGQSTLIFLDPPYFSVREQSHYKFSFNKEDHQRLARACKQMPNKFFLTYDDHPEVRKLYSWANIFNLEFYYRLDNSNHNNTKRKIGTELVITNYDLPNLDRKLLIHAAKTTV